MATKPVEQFTDDQNVYDTGPEAEGERRAKEQEALRAAFSGVISRLQKLADRRVQKRSYIEQRWLRDMRQYYGRFDETTEAALKNTPEKSRALINQTGPKTRAWEYRLGDLLFPADDKNWGISPTPVPELTEAAKQAAAQADDLHAQADHMVDVHNRDQAAGTVTPTPGGVPPLALAEQLGSQALDFEKAEADARAQMDVAKRASEGMAKEIDDQLTQCQYPRHARRLIGDMCRLGPGVMKGPLNGKAARRWKKVADIMAEGEPGSEAGAEIYQLAPTSDGNAPICLRVDPWSFFPDENACDMEGSESELERHLPNKSQLRKMAKTLDFDPDATARLLKNGPGYGVTNDLNYLAQLRLITDEGEAVTDRYVVWEYHGPLECNEVEAILSMTQGPEAAAKWAKDYAELEEVRVIVFFCDGELLKIEPDWLLDSNETLYSVVSFLKSESSILGAIGVPALMRDPQRALNAAWRMFLDNAGLSVGPQIVIDKARVQPENGSWTLEPRKVWTKTGDDLVSDAKPFEVFNIPSNTTELEQVIELAMKFIDDVTSLPLVAQGEQGEHITQTASGMSMLMNSANVIFRGVVKNFDDDLTTPLIRRFYDWNMQFNPKEEIKGDMQVEARGTSVLLVREVQSQNLMLMAQNWSAHPILGKAIKVYDAVRLAVQSLSINPDDVLVTRDEFDKALKDMAENQPQDPRIAAAQIDAESRKEQNAANIEIANSRLEAAIAAVQAKTGETREKIAADLKMHADQLQSSERMKAVDIAVEDQRAAEAKAEGQPADKATGQGVG